MFSIIQRKSAFTQCARVAELAGVTPTTLVRFAREMDCDGYAAFRRPFKAYLSRRSRGYADRAHDLRLRSGGVVGEMLRDIVVADQTNVERTLLGAGPERLDRVVDMIAKARRVYIIGLRKCYPIAHYLHYAYSVFRNNGYLVTDFAGTLPDQLKELGPDDVMLAISITRYSRQTVRCASFAASRGAKVIGTYRQRRLATGAPCRRTSDPGPRHAVGVPFAHRRAVAGAGADRAADRA